MSSKLKDLSIFNKFNFNMKPVGIKFFLFRPDGIKKLEKHLSLCEMIREAQDAVPFYANQENFTCVGPLLTGMADSDPVFESGHIGQSLNIFEEARAMQTELTVLHAKLREIRAHLAGIARE